MSNYFDVVISNNSFYIVEPFSKPKTHDSALETLKKIEFVIKNKLTYDSSHKDIYSDQSQYELFEILKTKSSQIHKGYHKKQSKLNWVFRKIFSKQKEISAIHTRIDNYIQPPQVLPLPNELIQEVAKYLGVSDLGILAQLNLHGKTHAATAIIRKARELGYEDRDHAESVKYIDDLFKEIIELAIQGIIPKKHLSYKENRPYKKNRQKFDSERILQNLQNLSTEDLFTILSNKKLYSPNFQKVRKIFNLKGNWKVTKNDSYTIKRKGSAALILSVKNGDKGISELLLQHGTDPNISVNGSPPLHWAAQAGFADIVELLLKSGASVNEGSARNSTALAFACGYGDRNLHHPNAKVVELLLQYGADLNIPANGSLPLHWAAQAGFADIVELLLKNDASVNERSARNSTALAFACGYGARSRHHPNAKVVELLLQHGADPNIPTNGSPPLHWASQAGLADIVELLLKNGASVNERSARNNTALVFACGYGDRNLYRPNAKVVELLLQHGADPNIPAQDGSTPLKISRQNNFLGLISLLLAHNAHL
jgi:ankyrin repeat protein